MYTTNVSGQPLFGDAHAVNEWTTVLSGLDDGSGDTPIAGGRYGKVRCGSSRKEPHRSGQGTALRSFVLERGLSRKLGRLSTDVV